MRDESDPLRDLGKQLPYDRPDPARRDAVRSSLLIAANEGRRPGARSRWILVGGGFAAGALAAAAIAIFVLRPVDPEPSEATHTRIGESTDAKTLYHRDTATATGTDRVMRVTAGTFSLEVPAGRKTEHVRLQTGDAEVEGTGSYRVVVAADTLASVTVSTGTATVRVNGHQQAVFLAAGETWRPTVITADLDVAPAKPDLAATAAEPASPSPSPSPWPSSTAASPSPTAASPTRTAALPSPSPSLSPTAASPTRIAASPTAASPSPSLSRTAASPSPSPTAASPSPSAASPSPSPSRTAASPSPAATKPRIATPSSATSSPPQVTAPAAAPTAPRPAVTAPVEPTPPVATGNSPTETAFRAGYALLRNNKFAAAALELGKAADGDGPLAADARYFQAVALTKAGRAADAERALVQFIDRAATSVRRGRAVVMLARLLAARGDSASARAWFEDALRDSDASVVAAARDGITGLN